MEAEYLKKVREGDSESFRYFVEKYSSKSYSLALGILKNPSLAEEVVQSAFVKAYSSISGFREESKFSTWFFRILTNECIQATRHLKKRLIQFREQYPDIEGSPEYASIDSHDRKKMLEYALSKLKPKESLVVRLYYLCELDMEEIGEATGYSIGNIKVILHRARQNLKTILEIHFAEEIYSIK